jgi:hypothetical protein
LVNGSGELMAQSEEIREYICADVITKELGSSDDPCRNNEGAVQFF